MDLEHELSRMLEASTNSLASPVHTIIAEATIRGRRLRRRRRLRIAGTAVVVCALLSGGALLGLHRPAVPVAAVAAGPTGTGAPRLGVDPAAGPSAPPTASVPAGAVPVTADGLLGILAGWLPTYVKYSNYRPIQGVDAPASEFTVDVNDGTGGGATVMVKLFKTADPANTLECPYQGGTDPNRAPSADPVHCDTVSLPDGGTEQLLTSSADLAGRYSYTVTAAHPGGTELMLAAWNGTIAIAGSDRGGGMTRQRPPFGIDFWSQVAQSPQWGLTVPNGLAATGASIAATAP